MGASIDPGCGGKAVGILMGGFAMRSRVGMGTKSKARDASPVTRRAALPFTFTEITKAIITSLSYLFASTFCIYQALYLHIKKNIFYFFCISHYYYS